MTRKNHAYLVSASRYFSTSDFFLLSTSKQGVAPKRFNIALFFFYTFLSLVRKKKKGEAKQEDRKKIKRSNIGERHLRRQ
jgi:hypothetical protein